MERSFMNIFLSKFRVKKVSGKTAFTYTESVDTRGVVVLDLLTVPFMSNSSVNCQLFLGKDRHKLTLVRYVR